MSFKDFLRDSTDESFQVNIDDIKLSASVVELAKKIKKLLDKGEDFDDVFNELTSSRSKTMKLRVHTIAALKKMGVNIKQDFEKH